MADLTEPDDEAAGLPAKLPDQRRPSRPVKLPDAEREKVIAELQRHCGDGLLTLDEFAERAGMVWAAATSMDLDAIVADLPATPAQQTVAVPVPMVGETRRKSARRWIVAVMSGANPKGRWRVGESLNVVCVMGGAEIDLREALFDGPELHITCVCIMGGASIIVPEGIEVDLGGFAFMGGKDAQLANVPLIPGAPRIRVTAVCIMGGMDVKSRRSVAELAAERNAKRAADREKRELRRAERAELQAEARSRRREPDQLGRPPRPPRPPSGRNIGREIRRTLHESILDSVDASLSGVNAGLGFGNPRDGDRWQTTDDDAAAVRRRLKRNGRPEGTVTIMFTDIEGSTELTERLGDESASVVLREHNELIRAQVVAHGGYEVKFRGDGFMLAFTSAARGVRCGIAIQQEMQAFAKRHTDITMRVRVGINSGEAVPEGNDFLGTAVNIAARLTDAANGGEVMVTSVVRDLVTTSGEFQFEPEQLVALKGISEPQRACLVEW